jgi:hypothetical protein
MPFGFYALLFGIACGLAVFFGSPALVNRAVGFRTSVSADIMEKLFWHIAHLDNFLRISFYLPALSVLALAVFAFDKKKRSIKDANYVFAWLCLGACFCAAGVLFLAPEIGWRVYYSATVFSILAFLFTLQYFKAVYGFSLTKYFVWAALAFALAIAPSVTLPYFALHRQDVLRWSTVERAKNEKRPFVILPIYIIPATPFPNYNIIYYEAIFRPQQERDYFYGIRTYRAHPLPQNERGVSTAVLF